MNDRPSRDRRPQRLRKVLRLLIPKRTEVPPQLEGKRLLGVLDLIGSVQPCADHHYRLEIGVLAERLISKCREAELIASAPFGDEVTPVSTSAITRAGWRPLPINANTEQLHIGGSAISAYDSFITAAAALHIATYRPEVIAFCTSEAHTVLALSDALMALGLTIPIVTVSTVGSSAFRLLPEGCPRVAGRVILGRDCLTPTSEDALPYFEFREFDKPHDQRR